MKRQCSCRFLEKKEKKEKCVAAAGFMDRRYS